jgi:L-lactate dehydrogenase complex protein LldG
VVHALRERRITKLIAWRDQSAALTEVRRLLEADGMEIVDGVIEVGDRRSTDLQNLDGIDAGLTGAQAGFADTGTVVLPAGPGKPMTASLLPWVHICLLPASRLFPDLRTWLRQDGREQLARASSVVLVTGPSRTADIELTLTRGVHGPGEVVVVCHG